MMRTCNTRASFFYKFIPAGFFILFYILGTNSSLSYGSTIMLNWVANQEASIAGYKVYYGTLSGKYQTTIDVKNLTSYTLPTIPQVKTFFAVTAYTASGSESSYSTEAVYVPGAADKDLDGVPDATDNCPLISNPGQADLDKDGIGDACDVCPGDPNKSAPGACGCGIADTDSDKDGSPDCKDSCPADPYKTAPGSCGCGVADTDSDKDGIPDCKDNCPLAYNPDQADLDKDGIGNACSSSSDSDGDGIPDDVDSDGNASALTGYWKFDETSGVISADASGYSNNGLLYNGTKWAAGIVNNGLQLDGSNDYVSLGKSIFSITAEFTVSCWINISQTTRYRYQTIIQKGENVYPFMLRLYGNKVQAGVRTSKTYYLSSNTMLNPGLWYNVTLTYRSGERILYINGSEDVSDAMTGTPNFYTTSGTIATIGRTIKGDYPMKGKADEFRIYNRALTGDEVFALYNATLLKQ